MIVGRVIIMKLFDTRDLILIPKIYYLDVYMSRIIKLLSTSMN